MLRQVSNGAYLDAIRMAEKFILHVEVLFGTIDDLEWIFAGRGVKGVFLILIPILVLLCSPGSRFFLSCVPVPVPTDLSSNPIVHPSPNTGMAHVREARMLCRKTVELFTLLSHTQETGARRMGMTQGLLALVTGLAHYLKILIRIALTGALKLERGEAGGSQAVVYQQQHQQQQYRSTANGAPPLAQGEAMASFLDKLHLLAVQGGNPAARRTIKTANSASSSTTLISTPSSTAASSLTHSYPYLAPNGDAPNLNPTKNPGTQGVTYGFRSLAPEYAGESPFWSAASSSGGDGGSSPGGSGGGGSTASGAAQSSGGDLSSNHAGPSSSGSSSSSPPSDLCVRCGLTVEEDCVRLGTYQRWHSQCVQCAHCGKTATVPAPQASGQTPQQQAHGRKGDGRSRDGHRSGDESTSTPSHPSSTSTTMQNGRDPSTSTSGSTSHPAPKLTAHRRPPPRVHEFVYDPDTLRDSPPFGEIPAVILCTEHAHPRCRGGFQAVQRLEQYAFLLNVALRRLYLLLKKQGVVPISPGVCLFFCFFVRVFFVALVSLSLKEEREKAVGGLWMWNVI